MKSINFNFTRNIHFTRLVKVNDRLREFNFRMLPGHQNALFHVDVPDDRGNRLMFKMQKEDNNWSIVEKDLPDWILASENMLHAVILEELQ